MKASLVLALVAALTAVPANAAKAPANVPAKPAAALTADPGEAARLKKYALDPLAALQKQGAQVQRISFDSIGGEAALAPAVSLTLDKNLIGFLDLDNSAVPGDISVPVEAAVWSRLAAERPAAYAAALPASPAPVAGCDVMVLESAGKTGAERRFLSTCEEGAAASYVTDFLGIASGSVPCAGKGATAPIRLSACYSSMPNPVGPAAAP